MSDFNYRRGAGPVFMRTYGRNKGVRRVDTWLSPDYRKEAFSCSLNSDPSTAATSDSSVRQRRRKKNCIKTSRIAKLKAMSSLKDGGSDDENVFVPETALQPTNQNMQRSLRGDRSSLKRGIERVLLSSMSENEQPLITRKAQKKSTRLPSTSESEEDRLTLRKPKVTPALSLRATRGQSSEENSLRLESRAKFVTSRRRVQSLKARGPGSKKRKVLRKSMSLNSSDDFVQTGRMPRKAVTRRKHPPQCPPLGMERSSIEGSQHLTRASRRRHVTQRQTLLRRDGMLASASLNASSDDPSLSYHVPLFSSTPSVLSRRAAQKPRDPSLSGIQFSIEDSATDADLPKLPTEPPRQTTATQLPRLPKRLTSPQPHREISSQNSCSGKDISTGSTCETSAGSTKNRKCEKPHEVINKISSQSAGPLVLSSHTETPSPQGNVGQTPGKLPSSSDEEQAKRVANRSQVLKEPLSPELSLEEKDEAGEKESSVSHMSSGFVTAETRLRSLMDVLKERCRSAEPMVKLPRLFLSPTLDTSSRLVSDGEVTFSSCLDNQPILDASGNRVKTGALFMLSQHQDLSTARSLCMETMGNSEKHKPGQRASVEEREVEVLNGDVTQQEEGDGKGIACHGRSGNPDMTEDLEKQLKARCTSCQPIVLLDSLRLSPFMLRHSRNSSSTLPPAASTQVKTKRNKSSSSGGSTPLSAAIPSSSCSSSSANSLSCFEPQQDQSWANPHNRPEPNSSSSSRQCPKRKLLESYPDNSSIRASSPEHTLLGARTKQQMATTRVGASRKAGVSGLSANRWTRTNSSLARSKHAKDSLDLSRMILTKQNKETVSNWMALPITPARAEQLNLSSMLAGLSPDASLSTHMWSRLKAALSLHKKKTALLTPQRLALSPVRRGINTSLDLFTSPACASLSHLVKSTPGSSLMLGEDISDADKVYQECHQEGPITFEHCIPPARMKLCHKIGEGTFGEVFSTSDAHGKPVALKIIPVEGKQKVNGENQKTFGEILHEIIISKELSNLNERETNQTDGFIGLNNLHCVQGSYPKKLLDAWDKFDKQRGSENERPDFFDETQIFLILEFEFGGSDLENMNGKLSSLAQAKSILQQVTAALAVAEQALYFEHRDLHWGNILVKSCARHAELAYLLNGQHHAIQSRGLQVNIIDYSLARLEIDGLTVSCDISSDEELFMGQGDYQFDIYRKMREENHNSWSEYNPHSNVLWLHYLTDKLLGMKYRGSAKGAQVRALKSSLQAFHRDLLTFKSATEVLCNSILFK